MLGKVKGVLFANPVYDSAKQHTVKLLHLKKILWYLPQINQFLIKEVS